MGLRTWSSKTEINCFMLREFRAHFEKWRILGYFLAKFPLEKSKITILTYNCAHLKSTKESVTFENLGPPPQTGNAYVEPTHFKEGPPTANGPWKAEMSK